MSKAVRRGPNTQINFDYLTGLGGSVEQEIRKTEDALVDYIAAERRREGLYDADRERTRDELMRKYPALQGQSRIPSVGQAPAQVTPVDEASA